MKKTAKKNFRQKKTPVSPLLQLSETIQQEGQSAYQKTWASYRRWEGTLIAIPVADALLSAWIHFAAAQQLWLVQMIMQFLTLLCVVSAIGFAQKLRFDWSWERFYVPIIVAAACFFLGPISGSALREYELKAPRSATGYFDHSDGFSSIPGRGGNTFRLPLVYAKFSLEGEEYVRLCTRCSSLEPDKPVALRIGRHFSWILEEDEEKTKKLRSKVRRRREE